MKIFNDYSPKINILQRLQSTNHTYNFVDPETGAHTQNVENMWHLAKIRNKRHCGTARNLLDGYLCEFMWRQRYKGRDLFDQIWRDIAAFMPPN